MADHEKLAGMTGIEEPVETGAVKMLLERTYEDMGSREGAGWLRMKVGK